MKFTTKMLINIYPSYLNHVKEDELNDEIIMYALEKGYDVINEKNDRFVIMYDNSYIDKSFIELYQIVNLIKQDYMEIYESIFVKENNKLGV